MCMGRGDGDCVLDDVFVLARNSCARTVERTAPHRRCTTEFIVYGHRITYAPFNRIHKMRINRTCYAMDAGCWMLNGAVQRRNTRGSKCSVSRETL